MARASQAASAITSTLTTATPVSPFMPRHRPTEYRGSGALPQTPHRLSFRCCRRLQRVHRSTSRDHNVQPRHHDDDFPYARRYPVGNAARRHLPVHVAPALAIPDNRPRGVTNTLTVTDDYEIADLDFRLTRSRIPDGRRDLMLRSPDGTGTDLIGLIGALAADRGNGDNIVNMVIDDASRRQLPTTWCRQPQLLHRSRKRGYRCTTRRGPCRAGCSAGSIGSLSRRGRSTKGTWTTLVSDQGCR